MPNNTRLPTMLIAGFALAISASQASSANFDDIAGDDGAISLDDAIAFFGETLGKVAYEKYDTDGDGEVTKDEVLEVSSEKGFENSTSGMKTAYENSSAGRAVAEERAAAGRAIGEENSAAGRAIASENRDNGQRGPEEDDGDERENAEDRGGRPDDAGTSRDGRGSQPEDRGRPNE